MPKGRIEEIPQPDRPGRRSELYRELLALPGFKEFLQQDFKKRDPGEHYALLVSELKSQLTLDAEKAARNIDTQAAKIIREFKRDDLTTLRRPRVGPGTVFVLDEDAALERGLKSARRKDRGRKRAKVKAAHASD